MNTLQLAQAHGLDYSAYRALVNQQLLAGPITQPGKSEDLSTYTRLNVQRMNRLDKTVQLQPNVLAKLAGLARPQTWVVLTEGWCGDAAQNVPVIAKIAATTPKLELLLLRRDAHPALMDQYLTNGGRAIPKLIALDTQTGVELGTWGPRPAAMQQLVLDWKADPRGRSYAELAEELHAAYAKDRTRSVQEELTQRLETWATNSFLATQQPQLA